MKIDEILKVHSIDNNPIEWKKVDFNLSEYITTIKNYQLMKVDSNGYNIYYLLDNDKRIGYVVFEKIKFGSHGVYSQIKLNSIDEKYRGKNLAIEIYKEIRVKENLRIMSDFEQTEDGKKLWEKLSKEMPVYGINNIGDILPIDQIKDLYTYNNTKNNWVLITENRSSLFTLCGSKEFCEGDLLKPHKQLTESKQ